MKCFLQHFRLIFIIKSQTRKRGKAQRVARLYASTQFLQTHHNVSMVYCTKVHEIFTRYRGYIQGSLNGCRFCDFPNRCKLPALTVIQMKAFHANLSLFHTTK